MTKEEKMINHHIHKIRMTTYLKFDIILYVYLYEENYIS